MEEDSEKVFVPCPASPRATGSSGYNPRNVFPSASFMRMITDNLIQKLENTRDQIIQYQISQDLPADEDCGFVSLITALSQHAYTAVLTIFAMICNLLPLFNGFLYLARFVLEKLIEILQSENGTNQVVKIAIFTGELLVITTMVTMICSVIILPVTQLFSHIIGTVIGILISYGT